MTMCSVANVGIEFKGNGRSCRTIPCGFFSGVSNSSTYYVYVRGICANGSRTVWSQHALVQ